MWEDAVLGALPPRPGDAPPPPGHQAGTTPTSSIKGEQLVHRRRQVRILNEQVPVPLKQLIEDLTLHRPGVRDLRLR